MINSRQSGFLIAILLLLCIQTTAQCPIENHYFRAGETLSYDLYFKYGLLHTKAGYSTLTVRNDVFNGTPVYKTTLLAKSTGVVNKLFTLSDTLSSYITKEVVPIAFIKNALEGDDYTQEKATYTYNNGIINITSKRVKNGNFKFNESITSESCIYDMVSIIYYARTLDYSNMKKGNSSEVVFLSGKKKVYMEIEYRGKETMTANNNKEYDCIILKLSINNKAFKNKEEAMTVYITNDKNRMPVRIDSKLKIGSTRAILKSHEGLMHTANK